MKRRSVFWVIQPARDADARAITRACLNDHALASVSSAEHRLDLV